MGKEDNSIGSVSESWSALDFSKAAEQLPGGNFMSDVDETFRTQHAREWASPFFVLRHLAPELKELGRPVRIACGGTADFLSEAGGRWLTLYGKTLGLPHGVATTVWSERRPPKRSPPRQVLMQLPQKHVTKEWVHALADGREAPDLLLLYAAMNPELELRLVETMAKQDVLPDTFFSCCHHVHALLLRQLLASCGYKVGPCVQFKRSESFGSDFGQGAVWFRVAPGERVAAPTEEQAEAWFDVYSGLQGTTREWGPVEAPPKAVCDGYGQLRTVSIAGDADLDAVMFTDRHGLVLSNGRFFELKLDSTSDGDWALRGQVSEGLLELAPDPAVAEEPYGGLEADEIQRYRRMEWLVDVIEERIREEQGDDEDPETFESGMQADGPSADAERNLATTATKESVGEEEQGAVLKADAQGARSWRLPREAGITDVLALAGLLGEDGQSTDSLTRARAIVLQWLSNRGYEGLSANESGHATTSEGEVTVETDGRTVWAVRYDDRRQIEQGATWRVELTLLDAGSACAVGLRLFQWRRSEAAPEPITGVPEVMVRFARELGLRDAGTPLLPQAYHVNNEAELDALSALIASKDRSQAVVVVSSSAPKGPDASVGRLAKRLIGIAHVVIIDRRTAFNLSERLEGRHSVYGNAVRVYRPGLSPHDPPGDHPFWAFSGQTLPLRVQNFIAEAAGAISVADEDLDDRVPTFRQVRLQLSESRLASMRAETQSLASTVQEERARHLRISQELEATVGEQKAQLQEMQGKLKSLQDELRAIRNERDQAIDDLRRHRHESRMQWNGTDTAELADDEEVYYPDSWEDLEVWASVYGGDSLVLLPSAVKAASESQFTDIPFAYKALHLLGHEYAAMRRRATDDEAPRLAFEERLKALNLEYSGVGDAKDIKRFKQEYERTYDGRKVTLDLHLKRRAGFDPTSLFRLYFHYCGDTRKVVVGHLPSHLTNRMTRNA